MATTKEQDEAVIKIAVANAEFTEGKNLFLQYAQSLDIDLSFQNFDDELNTIDRQYNKPEGALLVAYKNGLAVGCAGIRRLDRHTAELKRMFVQQQYRHLKIGKQLLEQALDIAKDLGYKTIRLDTLPTMTKAVNLYRNFGFYEISSYRFNPVAEAIYMEKKLD